jgi:LacI family transcriptional regulator
MRISLRDVANEAGVSVNTASGVLSSRENARVSAATRERVRRAAETLGYHPNHLAGSLRRGKTNTIGLILNELRNPFYLSILETLDRTARDAGYHLLLDAAAGGGPTAKDAGILRGWPVDGVLLWTHRQYDIRTFLGPQADGLPVVYLGYERENPAQDTVFFDLYGGTQRAITHLEERGCQRIALVSLYKDPDFRYVAYVEHCQKVGQAPFIIPAPRSPDARDAGMAAGESIAQLPVSERPDGLVCSNDLVAIGVYRALRRAGIRVPEEIKLIGFDNIPDIQYMEVPLTTVDTPIDQFCAAALQRLLARIGGDSETPPHPVVIPTRLIVGGSS